MEILKPNIFTGKKIISGVTKVNKELFSPFGFSITNAGIYNDEQVLEQRKYLADYLKLDINNMAFQKQIHSDIIKFVNDDYIYGESDALVTNLKDKILVISLADCQGILLYDQVNMIIAGIHSGWQGTRLNIAGKTINYLIDNFNSNPADLLIYLTPAASGINYEVGEEFLDYFNDSIIRDETGKFFFNNPEKVCKQLLNEGVKIENIERSNICTLENLEYHSFRRDKENSGRMAAFIGLI